MKIPQYKMDARRRMAALRNRIQDAINTDPETTYGEVLSCLSESLNRWSDCLLKDEWEEKESNNDQT